MSFNARLRSLLGLDGPLGAQVASSLRNAGALDVYGAVRQPGPFDAPPPEPIALMEPIPWELYALDPDGTYD